MELIKGKRLLFVWNKFKYNNGYKGVVYGTIEAVKRNHVFIKFEDRKKAIKVKHDWVDRYCDEVKVQ